MGHLIRLKTIYYMLPYLVEHMIGYYLWRMRSKDLLTEYHKKVGIYCNMITWRRSSSNITSLYTDSSVMYIRGNGYKHLGAIHCFITGELSGVRLPDYYMYWRKVNIPFVHDCGSVSPIRFIDCLESTNE